MDKTKHTSQEAIEETVSTRKHQPFPPFQYFNSKRQILTFTFSFHAVLQKAGNHMEHTLLASYLCLLVGHLVMDCKTNELQVRGYLRNGKFDEMVQILDKYYNFMNLTASVSVSCRPFRYYQMPICLVVSLLIISLFNLFNYSRKPFKLLT